MQKGNTMNIKERILEMDKIYAEENNTEPAENIEDLLLTLIVKFQLFEPCKYISEDEEWITFILVPPNDTLGSQIMTLKKSEIISYGICNEKNIAEMEIKPKMESESLYQ